MKRKTPLKRSPAPRRTARPKAVNRARRDREWLRAYGSDERVEWVKAQRCVACGTATLGCENHHVVSGGMGRKSAYTNIIPLCRICHGEYHEWGAVTFCQWYGIDDEEEAKKTERAWLAFSGTTETDAP